MATTANKSAKKRVRLMKLHERAQLLSIFGTRLHQLRIKSGLTPIQFEAKSGIDAGNLAKYESGHREPGLIVLTMMAKALDISMMQLLDFDDELFNAPAKSSAGGSSVTLLQSLMRERDLQAKDLVTILGVDKGLVSKILNRKRRLSKKNIRILANYFKIDIDLLRGPRY